MTKTARFIPYLIHVAKPHLPGTTDELAYIHSYVSPTNSNLRDNITLPLRRVRAATWYRDLNSVISSYFDGKYDYLIDVSKSRLSGVSKAAQVNQSLPKYLPWRQCHWPFNLDTIQMTTARNFNTVANCYETNSRKSKAFTIFLRSLQRIFQAVLHTLVTAPQDFSTNIVRLMADEIHRIIKLPEYRNASISYWMSLGSINPLKTINKTSYTSVITSYGAVNTLLFECTNQTLYAVHEKIRCFEIRTKHKSKLRTEYRILKRYNSLYTP